LFYVYIIFILEMNTPTDSHISFLKSSEFGERTRAADAKHA